VKCTHLLLTELEFKGNTRDLDNSFLHRQQISNAKVYTSKFSIDMSIHFRLSYEFNIIVAPNVSY